MPHSGPTAGACGFLAASSTDSRSLVFKEAVGMVHHDYAEVERILATTPFASLSAVWHLPVHACHRPTFLLSAARSFAAS